MPKAAPPKTPFSTPLSGSAREAEERIRSIFQYKKKRPPILFFLLACALALLCGGLVSCQSASDTSGDGSPTAGPGIAMALQYYDTYLNYIEIPTLVPPEGEELDQAAASINQELAELAREYAWTQDSPGEEAIYTSQQCLFYPAETERYLNLVFYLNDGSYSNDGDIRTWCYDKEEHALVTTQQALERSGLTEDLLCSDLEQYVTHNTDDTLPGALTPVPIQRSAQILGFRIGSDGRAVFYLSVTTGFTPTDTGGEYDPWMHLFCWDNGSFSRCDASAQEAAPLVPAEETLQLDPPLWSQWSFAGTGPKGGYASSAQGPYGSAREAYAALLTDLVQDGLSPEGGTLDVDLSYLDEVDPPLNSFTVSDVDGDGQEELILLIIGEMHAGYRGYVLSYDPASGAVGIALSGYPSLTFYGTGAVTEDWSYNQGLGGRFWPYTIYTYDAQTDTYRTEGWVDAWDRQIWENNPDFAPFPDELDTSGTGFLYFITDARTGEETGPVDASVYEAWRDQYLDVDGVLPLTWHALSEENIQALESGTLAVTS